MTESSLRREAIRKDVNEAAAFFREHIQDYLVRYEETQARRVQNGIPVIAFCGHGRSGKDLAAEWLGSNYAMMYEGSVSKAVCPLIAHVKGLSPEEAFQRRHEDREYWYEFCNVLREDDPTLLAKMTLVNNDVIAGIRAAAELEACKSAGVIDLFVWVIRDGIPSDPTVEFSHSDCDIVVQNTGTKVQYFSKLRRLATAIKLPTR